MEEEQELKIPETIIYDTIGPLALSAVDDSPLSDHLEPIAVFRNEISLETPQRASPASAAVDFFSLDVAADASARDPFPELLAAAPEPMTPAPAPEPKLESGWFHGNCKFKSPMLQLHKGIQTDCSVFWRKHSYSFLGSVLQLKLEFYLDNLCNALMRILITQIIKLNFRYFCWRITHIAHTEHKLDTVS